MPVQEDSFSMEIKDVNGHDVIRLSPMLKWVMGISGAVMGSLLVAVSVGTLTLVMQISRDGGRNDERFRNIEIALEEIKQGTKDVYTKEMAESDRRNTDRRLNTLEGFHSVRRIDQ